MSRWAYYGDVDPYICEWARNLIKAGLVPDGEVDCRSIIDVSADDLRGFRQCHFFCGILGWPLALQFAGWPDDRPVWTGSCPCQPLSSAGQRKGHADERHLWPAFHALISERGPATVFGEQVASKDGREWLAGVRADLEHLGYAVGAADLPAAGVGAPHIRQRLFWVAEPESFDARRHVAEGRECARENSEVRFQEPPRGSGCIGRLADAEHAERRSNRGGHVIHRHDAGRAQTHGQLGACGEVLGVADSQRNRCDEQCGPAEREERPRQRRDQSDDSGDSKRMGDAGAPGLPPPEPEDLCGARRRGEGRATAEPSASRLGGMGHPDEPRLEARRDFGGRSHSRSECTAEPSAPFWSRAEWLPCLDGKARRVESSLRPLAHAGEWGSGSRVGILRAAGNAIVPQAAAAFISAFMEARRDD